MLWNVHYHTEVSIVSAKSARKCVMSLTNLQVGNEGGTSEEGAEGDGSGLGRRGAGGRGALDRLGSTGCFRGNTAGD